MHQAVNIFRAAINNISIDQNLQRDTWVWKLNSKEKFSFKKVWKFVKGDDTEVSWHKVIWCKSNCPKMAHCSYFAILNRLPTKERCAKWTKNADNRCLLCSNGVENAYHLFFDCIYSRKTIKHQEKNNLDMFETGVEDFLLRGKHSIDISQRRQS